MAREFASIRVRVWQDDDFRALPKDAKLLYFTLLTMPALSYCGVVDWRPKRLNTFSPDFPYDQILVAASILEERYYVVIDEDTEELLIRSFIRNDGLMKEPRMAVSMARAYGAVGSRKIQGVIVHELRRLHQDFPELKGWHKPEASALLQNVAVDPRDVGPNASLFGPNETSLLPTPAPYSNLPTPGSTAQAQPKAPRSARATRIPDDFEITDDMRTWARENVPGMDIDLATKKFILHFQAASGQRATMISWLAAWKKWMLGDYKPTGKTSRIHPSRTIERDGKGGMAWEL